MRHFRGEATLAQFARHILTRQTMRTARERTRHSLQRVDAVDFETVTNGASLFGAEITQAEMLEFLDALPETHRVTLVLGYSFEHSVEEIAELTETCVGRVKKRLLRAKELLRAALHPESTSAGYMTEQAS